MRCRYVINESVGLANTARVRCSGLFPVQFYVDAKGNVVDKGKGTVELKGSGTLQNDMNLELATGYILRSSTSGFFKVIVTPLLGDERKPVKMKLQLSFGYNRLEQ